jgi:hypothetical protein
VTLRAEDLLGGERSAASRGYLNLTNHTEEATSNGAVGDAVGNPFTLAGDFDAIEREPIVAHLGTHDCRTTLLARGLALNIGGPSDASKSLMQLDLLGKLSSVGDADWLGLKVTEEQLRVGLVVYPGEGEDEDLVERVRQLVPAGAQLYVWDRWRKTEAPRATPDGIPRLAQFAAELALHVVAFDTYTSFFRGGYDCSRGIPEDAHDALDAVRSQANLPLGFVGAQHTRKRDTRATTTADELEELSGTFSRKVDGAIVVRKDGDSKRRRRVTYAKTRQGPKPDPVIVALPEDEDAAPRFSVVATTGTVKPGSEADQMAVWIREQTEPVSASLLMGRFNIGDTTLRNRREALEARGIAHAKAPWIGGNAHAYGTTEQWKRKVEQRLGVAMEEGSQ